MNRAFKILEIFWLFMGCVGVLMCVFSIVIGDYRGAVYFLVFFLGSGLMYAFRRKQRVRFEEKDNKQLKK